jgi:hypothetical protein
MYVVWHERRVKGNKKTRFLQDFIPLESVHATPWKPLTCEHRGEGRVARTPLIVYSERMRGKPTQTLLYRLPAIRSCCMADRFLRAAWWFDVEQTLLRFELDGRITRRPFDARDKKAILAKLREVVPRPTPAGVRDFTAFRLMMEREHQELLESIREARQAERRRREQEEARRRAEEQRRYWKWEYRFRVETSGQATLPDCFAVLGLPPDATPEQVKRRYRELAKLHHPDHQGDEEQFKRVQRAYEEASVILERRTPA